MAMNILCIFFIVLCWHFFLSCLGSNQPQKFKNKCLSVSIFCPGGCCNWSSSMTFMYLVELIWKTCILFSFKFLRVLDLKKKLMTFLTFSLLGFAVIDLTRLKFLCTLYIWFSNPILFLFFQILDFLNLFFIVPSETLIAGDELDCKNMTASFKATIKRLICFWPNFWSSFLFSQVDIVPSWNIYNTIQLYCNIKYIIFLRTKFHKYSSRT